MRWLIGVPVLALSIGCASSCKTPHCSEQHVVVHSADGTARVVKVPMQGSTGSRASGSPRYALGMDWAQISLPVPRLMAIPDHNAVPATSHVMPPGMAMQSPSAPGATLKTMSPTSPAALAAKSAAATTTPATPATTTTTTTASETTAPTTPTAAPQPPATTSEPTAATSPAPTTAEKPVPTMAEPLAVTHTTPAPTPPVTPPLPETVPVSVTPPGSAVVPASLPPLQEVAPATPPEPAAPETSAPPLYLPDNPPVQRRPSVSQQEIEEMKRQLEALEKQLREQNTAPEVRTPK